ncbi:MAG TPA: hypothetical protein DD412_05530, partial [Holosporales bacterium]|nr:hypothetical protein [Holosporales bacterium]
ITIEIKRGFLMSIPFKRSPVEFNQRLLFPTCIFDLLSEDHECYVYNDIFQQLDTTSLEKMYSKLGQNAYHPKTIISILIYAYSQGVFSSRQIERKCNEDLSFMFIAGMNCPNFRVLSDFRKNNSEFFEECFKQSVLLAMESGLASLGHVSLDGSKFKADTSKHKAMSFKRLKEKEQELIEEIEILIQTALKCDEEEDKEYKEKTGYEIPEDLKYKEERLAKIQAAKEALIKREEELNPGKPIDDKKQISFADFEARIMGKKGSGFGYQYNGQICVDEDCQIIVAQFISQNVNDKKEIKPAIEKMQETTGKLPSKISADNGYMSADNLEALEAEELNAFLATNKGEKKNKIPLDESSRQLTKAEAFRIAAYSLTRSKSALGAYYRRKRSQIGAPKAITATAHKIARLVYSLIKHGAEYVDPGQDYYEEKYRERVIKNLHKKAKSLGFEIVPQI